MSETNPVTLPDKTAQETAGTPPQQQGTSGRSMLMIGGVGCVLLLCIGLLVGSLLVGSFLFAATDDEAMTNETLDSTKVAEVEKLGADGAGGDETSLESGSAVIVDGETSSASTEDKPSMSAITFAADITAEGEPIEPGFSFEAGISQLHAIFEYTHLSPNSMWTQVWYHNGNEVLSTSQPWPEGNAGVFDYPVEAGDAPLPPGEWALEFYIDDELLTAGSFLIEDAENALETAEISNSIEINKIYRLVYTKWNGEKHDLFVSDTNGSSEQFIMGRAAGPAWSPDGRYIFFYGEEGVDNQVINGKLYPLPGATNGVIRINASPLPASLRQIQIFQGHGWNDGTARSANISPDGSMIAYDGDRGGGRRIYFLGTDANQQFRIEIIGEQADWSPDSQRIIYRSGRNNQTGLWISNRNDSGHTRITTGGTDSFPTWSPDGETIAFSRDGGGNVDIYTVKVDGSNLVRLTDAPGHDTLPLYTPDGKIIFRSARSGSWSIWKMDGDGSNQTQIIANAPVGPEWSFSKMDVLR